MEEAAGTEATRIVAIVGPTATGKTALAVELAHRLGSEILSADSRQVYRGLDLGTGKDLDEYQRVDPPVPVHLIDLVAVEETYTLARYLDDFDETVRSLAARAPYSFGRPLVSCGGTGLYIEAALRGFEVPRVPPNPALRAELELLSHEELITRLETTAPALAATTDKSTKRRVIRGLERAAAAPAGGTASGAPRPRIEPLVFVVELELETLAERIARRLRERLEVGLLAEVQRLLDRGVPLARLQALGLEYRELAEALVGIRPLDEAITRLEREIRRFAKRQRTWFRGSPRRGLPTTPIAVGDIETVWTALQQQGWVGLRAIPEQGAR